jgi:hypothetical protein
LRVEAENKTRQLEAQLQELQVAQQAMEEACRPEWIWQVEIDGTWQQLPAAAIADLNRLGKATYTIGPTQYQADSRTSCQTDLGTGEARRLRKLPLSNGAAGRLGWAFGVPMSREPDQVIGTAQVFQLRHGGAGADQQPDALHFALAAAQFMYMMQQINSRPQTVALWINFAVAEAFESQRQKFERDGKSTESVWVFHGTPLANISNIMSQGFKVGGHGVPIAHGAAHGHGVYTAMGPDTPIGYGNGNAVILARALVGNNGADSRRAHGDWIIFNSGSQLLPIYVLQW